MGKWVRSDHCRDWNWQLYESDGGGFQSEQVTHALLMDIREELKRLNRVLQCPNFIAVPAKLDKIERNTRKRRKKRPVVGKPKLRVVARS